MALGQECDRMINKFNLLLCLAAAAKKVLACRMRELKQIMVIQVFDRFVHGQPYRLLGILGPLYRPVLIYGSFSFVKEKFLKTL